MNRAVPYVLMLVLLGSACGPATSTGGSGPSSGEAVQPARTLVVAVEDEPKTLAGRLLAQVGRSLHFRRIFNADLVLLDDQSNPLPYLAEALPQLDSDSWKVAADGTMDTTYRLKANLVWHDGKPLTADAFVFGWQVYKWPEIGQAGSQPFKSISTVSAPDERTVMIHWSQPYAFAGQLQSLGYSQTIGLPPLPRHILGQTLESGSVDAMLNHPFWTTEYVGAGPYRVDRWEPGAYLDTVAFDRHALGAPKIPRIQLIFRSDPNAAVASMLQGEAQYAPNLPLAQANTLMAQGADRFLNLKYFNSLNSAHLQGRPDMARPAALQDRRVRQALVHAVDRTGLNDIMFEGQHLVVESLFAPTSELGRAAGSAAITYPFDLRRSAQLMEEAGLSKPVGRDFFVGPGGQEFKPDLKAGARPDDEALASTLVSAWRQAGFDFSQSVLPNAQAQDVQAKSTYPGLQLSQTAGGEGGINGMGTSQIPGPENGWRGSAWNGYSSAEMDRLIGAFDVALAPDARTRLAQDIVKLYTTDLPAIPLYFPVSPNIFVSTLKGLELRPAASNPTWNIYDWTLA